MPKSNTEGWSHFTAWGATENNFVVKPPWPRPNEWTLQCRLESTKQVLTCLEGLAFKVDPWLELAKTFSNR